MPSPFAYAAHLAGIVPLPKAETKLMRRGKLLEPIGVQLLAEDHAMSAVAVQERVERTDLPAVGYIDVRTTRGFVELKTIDEPRFRQLWTDRPPLAPRVQAQGYLNLTGEEMCYVGAIVIAYGEIRLELFEERAHPGMQRLMLDRAGEFLETLRSGRLPDPDMSESSYRTWSHLAQLAEGTKSKMEGIEATTWAKRWVGAKHARKSADQIETEAKSWFAANAPDAEIVELDDGTLVTRRRVSCAGYVVDPSTYVKWNIK